MKRLITIILIILFSVGCGDKVRIKRTSGDIINIEDNEKNGRPKQDYIKPNPTELQNLVEVENFLPKGYSRNGDIDYTAIIQKVLDTNRIIEFPNFPVLINDSGLNVRSNSKIIFNEKSLLKLKSSEKVGYSILNIEGVENVSVYSPKIEGDRYRRIDPDNTKGEWGMGIWIRSSKKISIYNAKVSNCWGDGVYIGGGDVTLSNDSILIHQAIINENRRNGISITSGNNIRIIEPVISNTHGTGPEAGIDIEPNNNQGTIDNIYIKDPYTYNNATIGIVISLGRLVSEEKKDVNITITNHVDKYSKHGFMIASFRSEKKSTDIRLEGKILVKNPKWMFNEFPYTIGITRGLCPPIEFIGAKVYSDESNPQLVNHEFQSKMNLNNEEVVFRYN